MSSRFHLGFLKLEEKLKKQLQIVLQSEEILWYQKSKEAWAKFGDRNTKFFHTTTLIRRQRNKVTGLLKEDGSWTRDSTKMKGITLSYFKHLFAQEFQPSSQEALICNFPKWQQETLRIISASFSSNEVR